MAVRGAIRTVVARCGPGISTGMACRICGALNAQFHTLVEASITLLRDGWWGFRQLRVRILLASGGALVTGPKEGLLPVMLGEPGISMVMANRTSGLECPTIRYWFDFL